MARKAREISKTGMYNIILRGKTELFKDDEDYNRFVEGLSNPNWKVSAYGLVSNTAFLCVKESEAGIAADVRTVVISYARYYNKKYQTEGRLFDDRFKSEPINNKAEEQNSINIVLNAPYIIDTDGYVSDDGGEYEMIPFYASAMGLKPQRKKSVGTVKQTEIKPEPVPQEKEEPKKPEPKQQKSLPAWLL